MKLIVGLGNPGTQYANHRHNIGFMSVDRIAEDHEIQPWKSKFQGSVASGQIDSERLILLKPKTFMNNSGQSVGEVKRYYKIKLEDIIVIHDELDLAPGRIRAKSGGGAAGHRGLISIQAHIGNGFNRIRVGIGHPGRKDLVAHYVLHDFSTADTEWLEEILSAISLSFVHLVKGNQQQFISEVTNNRTQQQPKFKQQSVAQEQITETTIPEQGLLSHLVKHFKK